MKKISQILVLLVTIIAISISIPIDASAASVYMRPKKDIYLVMDDSGSMDASNDVGSENDANYSLQALISMIDKEDTVNSYFLNSKRIYGNIDMKNKNNALIKTIRDKYPEATGSTPFDAVDDAIRDMKSNTKKDSDVESWLVIVTDGGFDTDPNHTLNNFVTKKLKNGKYPKLLFITTAPYNVLNVSNKNKNVYSYGEKGIMEAMDKVANTITGRKKINFTKSSNSISFSIPYPARNIVVFTQNSQNSIVSAKSKTDLNTNEKYDIKYPVNNPNLQNSTVFYLTAKNSKSIQAGDITLDLKKSFSQKNTTVLVEPAIAILAKYYNQDGTEIKPNEIRQGDTLTVKLKICDSETKKPIDDSTFVGGIDYKIDVNDDSVNQNEGDFKIEKDSVKINIRAKFKDGFTLENTEEYDGLEKYRSIILDLSNGGNYSENYKDFKKKPGITVTPFNNGIVIPEDEFKNTSLSISGDNFFTSRFKVKRDNQNGTYEIKPIGGIFKVLTPKEAHIDITFTDIDGKTTTESADFDIPGDRPWAQIIIIIIVIAILLFIILWMLINNLLRPKFPVGSKMYYIIPSNKDPLNDRNTITNAESVSVNLNKTALKQDPLIIFKPKSVPYRVTGSATFECNDITFVALRKPSLFTRSTDVVVQGIEKISYSTSTGRTSAPKYYVRTRTNNNLVGRDAYNEKEKRLTLQIENRLVQRNPKNGKTEAVIKYSAQK